MQNMKHKLTFIVSLGIALILTAGIGAPPPPPRQPAPLHEMGCLLRQWNFALVCREVYAKPDFPRLLLDGDSLHLLMPGCRHAGMVFPPSAKTPSGTERHDSRHIGMRIQKNTGEPLYQRNHHRRHDPPKPPPSGDLTGLSP